METDYFKSIQDYIDSNPTLLISGAKVDDENVPLNVTLSLQKLDKKTKKGYERLEERVETLEKEVRELKAERDALGAERDAFAERVKKLEKVSLNTKSIEINVAQRVRDMFEYKFQLATHQMEKQIREELKLKPSAKEPPMVHDIDDEGMSLDERHEDVKRETDVDKAEPEEEVKHEYNDVANEEHTADDVIASVVSDVAHETEDTENKEEFKDTKEDDKDKKEEFNDNKEEDKEKGEEEEEKRGEENDGRRPDRQRKRAAAVRTPYTEGKKKRAKKMEAVEKGVEKNVNEEQISQSGSTQQGTVHESAPPVYSEGKTSMKIPLPFAPANYMI